MLIFLIHFGCIAFIFHAKAGQKKSSIQCPILKNQNFRKINQLNGYQIIEKQSLVENENQIKELNSKLNDPNLYKNANLDFLNKMYKMSEQLSFMSIHILVNSYCKKTDQQLLNQLDAQMDMHLKTFK